MSNSSSTSNKSWIAGVAAASLLAMGAGGLLGTYGASSVSKTVQEHAGQTRSNAIVTPTGPADVTLRSVGPVITNLAGPGSSWVRIEAALVMSRKIEHADLTVAEIKQDMVAYLRTVAVSQIEGASGLQALLEDLNERVVTRSKGTVRQLIIETLVIQ